MAEAVYDSAIVEQIQDALLVSLTPLHQFANSPITAQQWLLVQGQIKTLTTLQSTYSTYRLQIPPAIYNDTRRVMSAIRTKLSDSRNAGLPPIARFVPPRQASITAGQPKFDIPLDKLSILAQMDWPYWRIAQQFNVSVMTVGRRVRGAGLTKKYTAITQEEVNMIVTAKKENGSSGMGEGGLEAYFRTIALKVPRIMIRNALTEVDGSGRSLRILTTVIRREYWVPFYNSLWHMDGKLRLISTFFFGAESDISPGHHKLIRYGFVNHGCIDGKSHIITYLFCANNNLASTVQAGFYDAVQIWGWPSRVRADYGGENLGVRDLMLLVRGLLRGL